MAAPMEHHDVARMAESGAVRRHALVASFGRRALDLGLDLDALLAAAAAHAAAGLGVERAKVLQHRPDAGDLLVRAGVGWLPGVVGRATLPAGAASPPGRAFQTGAAVMVEDISGVEDFEWSDLLRGHGVISLVNVPVRLPGGAVWGVLEADCEAPRRFRREHAHFLLSLAELLGAAIRRLEAEAELRDARGRAEACAAERTAVLDQLAEGVVVADTAGRVTFANEAAARIHGVARLDAAHEACCEACRFLTEDGRPCPPAELPLARAALRGEAVSEARWRIRRPDGSEVLVAGSARPVRGPDSGAPLGAVLTLRDETARDAAERALAESEARFRAVADNIPQLAWMAEPDGWRTWFNKRWHDYTGLTPEEARGDGWRRVHHPEFLERVLAGMRRAWEAGEPWEDSFPLLGRDGDYRWFLTRAVPVRDARGRPVRWFGTNTDVTDQPA